MGRPQSKYFRRGGKEAGWTANLPRTTRNKQGDAQCHGPLLLPLGRVASAKFSVGTQWTCCREKAVCALVPQRPTACCCHCVDTFVRCTQEPACPPIPTLRNLPAGCPSLNSTGMQTSEERGPPGAHGLGNDEVANHQVGGWNPQYLLGSCHLCLASPQLLVRVLAFTAGVIRHTHCPKQDYLHSAAS